MYRSSILAAALICAAFPANAEEARRELGPHQHGHGRLNIAIEASRVSMELEVPAHDIVGFEHEPATPEQKAAMEKAKATLAGGLALFKPSAAAECKLTNAKISTEANTSMITTMLAKPRRSTKKPNINTRNSMLNMSWNASQPPSLPL